ncbi:hypothetical protein [[Leptolyngbya] sp. PCC 7376]|uniref:hypothetical protein n=1 Tax=[Leptolyngbya] sp. PCC 7376 TaxID=111781 RepID=UPI0005A201C8|nr:hypothetical protein [[Leptolyngbya] sp. PCC 7376]
MDYDLVIIGATQTGLVLAKKAIAQRLRVALVQQVAQPLQDIQLRALERIVLGCAAHSSGEKLRQEISKAIASTDFYEPLVKLMDKGVDVIPEVGKFQIESNPIFVTETRTLKSKNYAITTSTVWEKSDDPKMLTLPDFLKPETWQSLNQTIIFKGITPELMTLAYGLSQQGKKIQLLLGAQFFGTEDQQLTHRLQTFLEVAGIEVYRNTSITEQAEFLQQENAYIIDSDLLQGKINSLNLSPKHFRTQKSYLKVNHKLQTSTLNIYGCGSILGGYDLPELAIAEADFLIQSLIHKKRPISPYPLTPYRLFEPYPFDHVGYQGKYLPPDAITQEKTFFLDYVDQLRFPMDLTIKLWLTVDQKMLGATVLGDHSGKLIYACRDLIKTKQPFQSWDNLLEYAGIAAEICW